MKRIVLLLLFLNVLSAANAVFAAEQSTEEKSFLARRWAEVCAGAGAVVGITTLGFGTKQGKKIGALIRRTEQKASVLHADLWSIGTYPVRIGTTSNPQNAFTFFFNNPHGFMSMLFDTAPRCQTASYLEQLTAEQKDHLKDRLFTAVNSGSEARVKQVIRDFFTPDAPAVIQEHIDQLSQWTIRSSTFYLKPTAQSDYLLTLYSLKKQDKRLIKLYSDKRWYGQLVIAGVAIAAASAVSYAVVKLLQRQRKKIQEQKLAFMEEFNDEFENAQKAQAV